LMFQTNVNHWQRTQDHNLSQLIVTFTLSTSTNLGLTSRSHSTYSPHLSPAPFTICHHDTPHSARSCYHARATTRKIPHADGTPPCRSHTKHPTCTETLTLPATIVASFHFSRTLLIQCISFVILTHLFHIRPVSVSPTFLRGYR